MFTVWESLKGLKVLFCCLWAFCTGCIVVCAVINRETLVSHSTHSGIQAMYNVQFASLIGFVLLLPAVSWNGIPWHKRTERWSLAGVNLGVNSFIAAPLTVPIIGAQATQMISMCGNLCCGLCLDWSDGAISFSDYGRLLAFAGVLLGSYADMSDAASSEPQLAGRADGAMSFLDVSLILFLFAGGMGVSIQSRCNARFTQDFGSWTYAIAINLAAFALLMLPFSIYFWLHLGVAPVHSTEDLLRMLFDGSYFVFYFGSLALLPRTIGYTATCMSVKFGCMAMSSVLDAQGVNGRQVPFSHTRLASLMVVLAGVSFFSANSGATSKTKDAGQAKLTASPLALEEAKTAGYGALGESARGS